MKFTQILVNLSNFERKFTFSQVRFYSFTKLSPLSLDVFAVYATLLYVCWPSYAYLYALHDKVYMQSFIERNQQNAGIRHSQLEIVHDCRLVKLLIIKCHLAWTVLTMKANILLFKIHILCKINLRVCDISDIFLIFMIYYWVQIAKQYNTCFVTASE